ncbi:MAG: 30S ribosomal protein S9 [Candidatus Paceibacterota bacterium]
MTATKKQYVETIGRRKTATARVRITEASKASYVINDKDLATYFPTEELQKIVTDPFKIADKAYAVSVHVKGSGIHSQAEAVRHGLARALVVEDESDKTKLKQEGFLKRDPRSKERRKFGLKKARKAPQWSKR